MRWIEMKWHDLTFVAVILVALSFLISNELRSRRSIGILKGKLHEFESAEDSLVEAQKRVESLEELNQSKNDFITTINHELRTPLTSIIGYIELMKGPKLIGMENKTALNVVERNSEVLLDLVDGVLSLSHLDNVNAATQREVVDLRQVILRKISILEPQYLARKIQLVFNHDEKEDYTLIANHGQMPQLVMNLLSNAIKFSNEGGLVNINLSSHFNHRGERDIQLVIQDFGIGIPKKDIPNLFTRFYRASNVMDSQIQGSGLGLSIIWRIVDLHHGSITVDSQVGRGTSFTVTLPRN